MIRFAWIENRRSDLLWYVGAPLAGLLVVPLAFLLRAVAPAGLGASRSSAAALVIVTGWAFLLDGPHFWPTLARTVLDPGEWRRRGGVLGRSFVFFVAAPALVLLPWRFGAPPRLGPELLLIVFLAWAYWHTARQHWGFFRLYARKGGVSDRADERADWLAFHLLVFVPPGLFLTSAWYPGTGGVFPPLGTALSGGLGGAVRSAAHDALLAAYVATVVAYACWQVLRFRRGKTVNGSKLLFLGAVAPVQLVPFASPALPVLTQAIVGTGHALQYQRIVWRYGRAHYGAMGESAPRLPRKVFASAATYAAVGFVFTLLLLRGPVVERMIGRLARAASAWGASAPAPLLRAAAGAFFMGWLFQHYYLDARIWRLGRDEGVRRSLLGEEGV